MEGLHYFDGGFLPPQELVLIDNFVGDGKFHVERQTYGVGRGYLTARQLPSVDVVFCNDGCRFGAGGYLRGEDVDCDS